VFYNSDTIIKIQRQLARVQNDHQPSQSPHTNTPTKDKKLNPTVNTIKNKQQLDLNKIGMKNQPSKKGHKKDKKPEQASAIAVDSSVSEQSVEYSTTKTLGMNSKEDIPANDLHRLILLCLSYSLSCSYSVVRQIS
jgi:hypothetical protein